MYEWSSLPVLAADSREWSEDLEPADERTA